MSRGSTVGKAHPSGSVRSEAKALFRNAILDAAEIVFAERGFHEARIQDIAARARIAVGTVYNHFETKEDVLAAQRVREALALYQQSADLIQLGAHVQGTNPKLDQSIRARPKILDFLRQGAESFTPLEETRKRLFALANEMS